MRSLSELAPWFDYHTGCALVLIQSGDEDSLYSAAKRLEAAVKEKTISKHKHAATQVRKLRLEEGDDFTRAVCDILAPYSAEIAVRKLILLLRQEIRNRRQLRLPGVG